MHGRTSPISHDGNGLFLGLAQEFQATRYHSLTLSSSFSHHQHEEEEEEELRITAWTQDKIIMGVQHVRFPFYGVQFHPEVPLPYSPSLFNRMVSVSRFLVKMEEKSLRTFYEFRIPGYFPCS